jgi:DNA-binding NarL/FixJ family response regulator
VIPDLAVSRGDELYRHARSVGDRWLEFVAAGGTAMAHLDLGDVEEAERWLDRAGKLATESPTPLRARQIETWRGRARAVAGDAEGMRRHLERAVQLATEQGRPAARCEALARLAIEAARLGAEQEKLELLAVAESAARDAKGLVELLPGHPPWGIQADASLAEVALARGEPEVAVDAARSAVAGMREAIREDPLLDAIRAIAKVFIAAGTDEEREMVRYQLGLVLGMTAMRTMDEDIRARWFRGPLGNELSRLAGPLDAESISDGNGAVSKLDASDSVLLRLLTEGRTNHEIATQVGVTEAELQRRLAEMFGRIGASSRAEATAFAFRERVV